MITCRELIDFLSDYVDGVLPEGAQARFEEHLRACPECVDYVRDYRTTIALGKSACGCDDCPDLTAGMPDTLIRAILAARRAS